MGRERVRSQRNRTFSLPRRKLSLAGGLQRLTPRAGFKALIKPVSQACVPCDHVNDRNVTKSNSMNLEVVVDWKAPCACTSLDLYRN